MGMINCRVPRGMYVVSGSIKIWCANRTDANAQAAAFRKLGFLDVTINKA